LASVDRPFFSSSFIDKRIDSGAQPIVNTNRTLILAVNGEIYNHRALRKSLKNPHNFKTHSDCEVILHLVSYWLC
jgi:asparagine synthase (glutamine-hydrolysing)